MDSHSYGRGRSAGSRVSVAGDRRRAAYGATQRGVGRCPRSAHPGEANVTLGGVGVRQTGQQFGAPLSLFGSLANLGSPIRTIWLFVLLPNVPNGPFPGHVPRDPLCRGRAGVDRPRGHASPAAGAPKPRASRLLAGLPAGGLRWGQEWGEVSLPAARVPAAALGTDINSGWVGTRPVGLGAQATPADGSTSQLSCSAGLPPDLPYYLTSPRLDPQEAPRSLSLLGDRTGC